MSGEGSVEGSREPRGEGRDRAEGRHAPDARDSSSRLSILDSRLSSPLSLEPLGDRAFLASFPSSDAARAWASAARIPGVIDVVLAYAAVGVFADDACADVAALGEALRSLAPRRGDAIGGRAIEIPTLYDGEDLPQVASASGLDIAEVIARHSGRDYRVQAIGFLPGFAYAGDLDEALSGLPRRSSPRPRVAAGSVAIAGRHTGVYPQDSPGGWHLLGRTPLRIVDWARGHFPIGAGDAIRFRPIDPGEYERLRGELLGGDSLAP